jgi:hypothetical protein
MELNDKVLWVVTVITNPKRYKRRYELFEKYKARMLKEPNVRLVVVEAAFGDRIHHVTSVDNPYDVQVRTRDEIWHKENLINIGVQRIPPGWKYVAWIDADLIFTNEDWVAETIHELQHRPIVQLFQTAIDQAPDGRALQTHQGFAWQYYRNAPRGKAYAHWHPGFAWAATYEAWNAMGGLVDFAILGSADHHMARAWIGETDTSLPAGVSVGYHRLLKQFEVRAIRYTGKRLGFVKGSVMHEWHGKKANRKYVERWKILLDNDFDPTTDLHRDWQGLWMLNPDKPQLAEDISKYFGQRNEDGIDE